MSYMHLSGAYINRDHPSKLVRSPSYLQTEEFIGRELWMLEECSIHPNMIDTLGFITTS